MPILSVNVDHVATLRQARLGTEPDPVTAAGMAELAGACGIIVHLREDRRHIQDRDVKILRQTIQTKMTLEMGATKEMQAIAMEIRPEVICLVPENRQELTTEGGLNCLDRVGELSEYIAPIVKNGTDVSLFIDADKDQIAAARDIGAKYVEIHTGHYADYKGAEQEKELERILEGITTAQEAGLVVNLGHGLNYVNILAFANVPGICEYSIGHSIMSRAIYVGIDRAVKDMAEIVRTFTD